MLRDDEKIRSISKFRMSGLEGLIDGDTTMQKAAKMEPYTKATPTFPYVEEMVACKVKCTTKKIIAAEMTALVDKPVHEVLPSAYHNGRSGILRVV